MPASLRKELDISTGQKLLWQKVSDHECRILVVRTAHRRGPKAMLGFARRLRPRRRSTAQWMEELREGET
jgi:hypothetical protein